jgi:hypothetical protein
MAREVGQNMRNLTKLLQRLLDNATTAVDNGIGAAALHSFAAVAAVAVSPAAAADAAVDVGLLLVFVGFNFVEEVT